MSATVSACLKEGIEQLEKHAVPEARISAEMLLSHVLSSGRSALYAEPETVLESEAKEQFQKLVSRRSSRYPLQYLLQTVSFYNAELQVNEQCLIPRPETEFLVEVVLKEMENRKDSLHVLDIGTGSGNIAVSLAKARSSWQVFATDISNGALRLADQNARVNGVRERTEFFEADLWPANCGRRFDLVISNPPYLTSEELDKLQPEVAFEPGLALDGGRDGLVFYRRIVERVSEVLKADGHIFFEVGMNQAVAVSELLLLNHFRSVRVFKDYSGIERVVTGQLKIDG